MRRRNVFLVSALALVALVLVFNNLVPSSLSESFLKRSHKHDSINLPFHLEIDPSTFTWTPQEVLNNLEIAPLSKLFSHKYIHNEDGSVDEEIEPYIKDAWKDWKHACGRKYETKEEEQKRFEIWKVRFLKIEENNQAQQNFTESESCFMDLTKEEWEAQAGGYSPDESYENHENTNEILEHEQSVPTNVNWKDVIQLPMRAQQCGDCWANAATSAVEALYQIIGNPYLEFSVQENVDCAKPGRGDGCKGGQMTDTFKYFQSFGAVPAKNDPYEGKFNQGEQCQNDPKYRSDNKKFITNFNSVRGNCNGLKAAVAQQPITVAIEANEKFKSTRTEVLPFQSPRKLNHAVLLIGYTPEYWIIQNSWGSTNGYFGYYRLAMGDTLGICTDASYPVSNQQYKLKPKTGPINFIKDFAGQGGAAGAGINLMAFIGTKFSVVGGNYGTFLQNTRGERLNRAKERYFIIPEGRDKTDFNFFRISFIFVDAQTNSSFDIIFEAHQSGLLKATNIKNKEVMLAQCKTNNIGSVCDGRDDKNIFIFSTDSQFVMLLNWQKP